MKSFNQFLTEALTFKQQEKVEKWVSQLGGEQEVPGKKISEKVFGGKEVLYHPFEQETDHDIPIPESVHNHLKDKGFSIPSSKEYKAGYAVDKYNRMVSIGKALKKTQAPQDVVSSFENDPNRNLASKSGLSVAYTWKPNHVAGMSTDRGWTSCMNMSTGSNKHYLQGDIDLGTHVAYLINEKDKNIENPIARIALKPFTNEDGHIVLRPEGNQYGQPTSAFHSQVSNWAETHFPMQQGKTYSKNPNLYSDDYVVKISTFSKEGVKSILDKHIISSDNPFANQAERISTFGPHSLNHAVDVLDDMKKDVHPKNIADTYGTIVRSGQAHHLSDENVNKIASFALDNNNIPKNHKNSIISRISSRLSDKLNKKNVNKIFDSSVADLSYSSNIINHKHISDDKIHDFVKDQSDDKFAWMQIAPHRVTNDIANTFVDSFSDRYHSLPSAITSVTGSKNFTEDHFVKLANNLKNNKHLNKSTADSNIISLQSANITSPNYTINAARKLDKSRQSLTDKFLPMAVFHPQAELSDANRYVRSHNFVNGTNLDHLPHQILSGVSSSKIFDDHFENHPETIMQMTHHAAHGSKYDNHMNLILGHDTDTSDFEHYRLKKSLSADTSQIKNSPLRDRAEHTLKDLVSVHAEGDTLPEKETHVAIDNAIKNENHSLAMNLMDSAKEAIRLKKSHIDFTKQHFPAFSSELDRHIQSGKVKVIE